MIVLAPVLLGAAAPVLVPAALVPPVLVPDVSQRKIEIAYSFTGAELLLFGAILYPGGRVPESRRPADIVVVVKGPTQPILLREKQRVAGIWVNADSNRYRSAPSFYAIASSRPIEDIVDERGRAIFELGLDSLQLSPASGVPSADEARFAAGLVDLMQRTGLYFEDAGAVEVTDDVLYRARLIIPARVPVGKFTAETFLVQDGRVLSAAVREIDIRKSGFERFVAAAAEHAAIAYGLVAVLLSLGLGWGAGAIWRRF